MITNTWTDAPAGLPAEGLVVRPRCESRAPEAFKSPYQGTGLPFGGAVVDTVITPPTMQRLSIDLTTTDNVHIGTTLGIHSSRRPPG
jgi:hypothetical protein